MLRELFPDDALLQRWLELAPGRVAFQGLPARICWLGFGDRARRGSRSTSSCASGKVTAPVVIGRDHLDAGSVASPYRETEAMRDGSDAIADWPILNALVNVAAGATWVSVHHGGGVGIGNSIHAGMVVLADGTSEAAERLERVLTTDPGNGRRAAPRRGLPGGGGRRARARHRPARRCARLTRGRPADSRARAARDARGRRGAAAWACARRRRRDRGRLSALPRRQASSRSAGCATCGRSTGDVEELDGSGLCAVPGLVDCHTHPAFGGDRVEEFSLRAAGATYEELHAAGGGHPLDGPRDARTRRGRAARSRPRCTRVGCSCTERRPGRGSRATGSTATPSSPRCARSGARAGRRPGSGRTPCRRSTPTPTSTSHFALAEVLPTAAQLADAADVFLERGAFDAAQARRYLAACRDAGLALRLHGDQFTESGAVPLAIELGARSVDHLEATGRGGSRRSRRAT